MSASAFLGAVATAAAVVVYVVLEGNRAIRQAFDELEARKEWEQITMADRITLDEMGIGR